MWDSWEDEYLVNRYLAEDRIRNGIWVTREGREISIKRMSDAHLLNAIRMLERNCDTSADLVGGSYHQMMVAELARRESQMEDVKEREL